ncbi:HAD family hydrolase [Austwickia chelonae]|uniref:HAD family hydrolase n=1 Tax=Austwickia chelonae TaxID=100225 RepID=UPI0013C349CD|nr:HAD family hydrolase [Austwickia chelonae]
MASRIARQASPRWRETIAELAFPAVVATDLDGTLLNSQGVVSPFTRRIFEQYVAAGGTHVMVTARPPRWLSAVVDMVEPDGVILSGNGAFVVHAGSGEVVDAQVFSPEEAGQVVRSLRHALPGVSLAAETAENIVRDAAFITDIGDDSGTAVDELGRWLASGQARSVGKIIGRCPGLDQETLYRTAGEAVGTDGCLAYSGAVGLLEITAPEATKSRALREWCDQRGFSAPQVWAFGDMPNDLSMLTWAGQAFAPANAHRKVTECVTTIVPHHDDDGVAQAVAEALRTRSSVG